METLNSLLPSFTLHRKVFPDNLYLSLLCLFSSFSFYFIERTYHWRRHSLFQSFWSGEKILPPHQTGLVTISHHLLTRPVWSRSTTDSDHSASWQQPQRRSPGTWNSWIRPWLCAGSVKISITLMGTTNKLRSSESRPAPSARLCCWWLQQCGLWFLVLGAQCCPRRCGGHDWDNQRWRT